MSTYPSIQDNNYTSLFLAADSASNKAQSSYISIVAIDLISMIVASSMAVYNYQTSEVKLFVYIIAGLLLLLSLLLTIVLLTKKFEDFWYQGRALAESCKTLSWRFMTKSEMFEDHVPINEARERFVKRIQELGNEFSDLNKTLNANLISLPVITQFMLNVRSLPLIERMQYYIENRIENQKKWYSNKAEWNKKRYNFWFFIIILNQALAICCITYLIYNPNSPWNFVGLATTISAAALGWLQLKRHQELKQSYTTAAQELNIIVSLSEQISTEVDFSKFVLDSENAVSREHTLWLAQKRK
jgi:hypothetical protein